MEKERKPNEGQTISRGVIVYDFFFLAAKKKYRFFSLALGFSGFIPVAESSVKS